MNTLSIYLPMFLPISLLLFFAIMMKLGEISKKLTAQDVYYKKLLADQGIEIENLKKATDTQKVN